MSGDKTSEGSIDPDVASRLPDEVLADLANLIDAMDEGTPSRPAPVIPVVKTKAAENPFASLTAQDVPAVKGPAAASEADLGPRALDPNVRAVQPIGPLPTDGAVPLPENWLSPQPTDTSRRLRRELRQNWPFLLALIFIIIGIVLILLVLTSN